MNAESASVPDDQEPALRVWLRLNAVKIALVAALVVLVCRYLEPLDVLMAACGLGLIIFLHELGHFLAAKACNVHVPVFSIGFGPALPFCKYKFGETTYKIGVIPLGGFVKMVGETSGETNQQVAEHDGDDDPRSFKNKPVWQRMIIISGGVFMNLVLAAGCFIAAYMNGVKEAPPIIEVVEPGSAAWKAGIRPGTQIARLGEMDHPWFDDIKPTVMATRKGETVFLETVHNGERRTLNLEPQRGDDALYPLLGILPPTAVKLQVLKRDPQSPFALGSPFSRAKNNDGSDVGFLAGDTIVEMSDPAKPDTLTPLDGGDLAVPHLDFNTRLGKLAGKPVRFKVQRISGQTADLTVEPTYRKDLGLRMKMGPIVAVRTDSTAAKADVKSRVLDGEKELEAGDRLVSVELTETDGGKTFHSVDPEPKSAPPGAKVELLDPTKLPFVLNQWADRNAAVKDRKVKLRLLRQVEHTDKEVALELPWEDAYRDDFGLMQFGSSTVTLGGIGLAYRIAGEVNHVVPESPAAKAGIKAGDVVISGKFYGLDPTKGVVPGETDEIELKPSEQDKPRLLRWAMAEFKLQLQAPHAVDLVLDRAGTSVTISNLQAVEDKSYPLPLWGLQFDRDLRVQKAEGVAEALTMGYRRTVRAIKQTYQNLYGMVFGRISVKVMSGPISLARVSYIFAGEDTWKLVLFVALISINLAVVNFLPIPVLDGGHMMFLLYEGIFRRPVPMRLQVILTWIGVVAVMGMMAFTLWLDVVRLWDRFVRPLWNRLF